MLIHVVAIGAVLIQEKHGVDCVIAYSRRS